MRTQLEIEKKFIIEKPDFGELRKLDGFSESSIIQIYLENTEDGGARRIRCRTTGSNPPVYTETVKRAVDGMSAVETEREITEEEFSCLRALRASGTVEILKMRYTADFGGKTLEIDLYPAWERSCVMEIELNSRDESYTLPPFIKIIKDVTGDRSYSNHSMSRVFPEELI